MKTIEYVSIAKGEKKPQLVLKNCLIVNVFNEKIEKGDIAIHDGIIIGIGKYNGQKEIQLKNKYVCPGFIDGHVHIESSMLTPPQFSKVVTFKGTTTVIADPHEIANVCGITGIEYMLKSSENLPLDIYIMLPSCVPATNFENSGAILLAKHLKPLLNNDRVLGLGEMMDYMGVINGNKIVHDKLNMENKIIDGHAPNITNKQLNAYIVAGIKTDHECTNIREMEEKLSKGMYIHIREGSATKNLKALIKGVNSSNLRRILFCTDDKQLKDIKKEGHIDFNVRLAIKQGITPIQAIKMATLNTAECYRLYDRGAIAPGYIADLLVMDDLENINIEQVFKRGKLIKKEDKPYKIEINKKEILNTVNIKNINNISFDIKLKTDKVKVIKLEKHNVLTKKVIRKVTVKNGLYQNNEKNDILKIAVIERHKLTGNVGLGLVEGYGFKNGAIALTIAHDSHNIIVVGDNDEDMKLAVSQINEVQGGITICQNKKILATLQLEIAGLMTQAPINEIEKKLDKMVAIAINNGVTKFIDPFLTLAFLSLPVIPELKITDRGLFDTKLFDFTNIEE